MPIRPPCGTRLGSGRPTAAIEHTGSPTVPAAAIRRAAASAVGDVYHAVTARAWSPPVGDGAGFGGLGRTGAGVVTVREGRVDGLGVVGRVGVGRAGAPVVAVAVPFAGVRSGFGRCSLGDGCPVRSAVAGRRGRAVAVPWSTVGSGCRVRSAPVGPGERAPVVAGPGGRVTADVGRSGDRVSVGAGAAGREADTAGPSERLAVVAGRGGRSAVVVGPGERDPVEVGRAVLGVADVGVQVGRGLSVGRDKSVEDEGSGLGVSPSCATRAHTPTPTPPRASATAPPAIHGARRGGRR